jgi:hypothetical protein
MGPLDRCDVDPALGGSLQDAPEVVEKDDVLGVRGGHDGILQQRRLPPKAHRLPHRARARSRPRGWGRKPAKWQARRPSCTACTSFRNGRNPADAEVAARIAEAPGLRSALAAASGTVGTAKARRVADITAIDLFDGRIYIAVRDLHEAGRQAIRIGDPQASLSDYRFHRLDHRKVAREKDAATPPPTGTTTASTLPDGVSATL